MITNEPLALLVAILALVLVVLPVLAACLIAFFAVLTALFPGRVARTHAIAARMPGRAFLVGVVNALFLAAIGLGLIALAASLGPSFDLLALLILAVLGGSLVLGLAGVVQLLGERLFPRREGLARTGLGALALAFGSAMPYLGWFGLLPGLTMLGLGALVIGLVQDARAGAPPAPTMPPA